MNTLDLAADLIEEYGWIQGESGDTERGFCASGAIGWIADSWLGTGIPAIRQLESYLGFDATIADEKIVDWNDSPDRSSDQVIAALRAAARAQQ